MANGNKGEALSEGTLGTLGNSLAIDLRSEHSLARHISFGIFTNWDWTMHLQLTLESEQIQLTLESEYSLANYIGAERQRETLRDIGSHEQQRLLKSPTVPCNRTPQNNPMHTLFFNGPTQKHGPGQDAHASRSLIFSNWDWNMHLQLTLESEHSQLTLESEYSLATYIGAERQRETQRDIGSHEQRRLHKSPTRPLRQNPTKQYNACFIFQWSNTEAWSRARCSHESIALGHRPGAHPIGRQSSIKRSEYHI